MTKEEIQSTHLSINDYLRERVDDQLSWYSRKSAFNKRCYFQLQLLALTAAVSIPVISLSSEAAMTRIIVAVIGAVAALATGVLSLYQFRDQWTDYRSTAESLKLEKYLFLTRSAPYDDAGANSLFVNRVEAIIIQENRNWLEKKFTAEPDAASTGNTIAQDPPSGST